MRLDGLRRDGEYRWVIDPIDGTTLTSLGDFRARFERPAADSWHAQLA